MATDNWINPHTRIEQESRCICSSCFACKVDRRSICWRIAGFLQHFVLGCKWIIYQIFLIFFQDSTSEKISESMCAFPWLFLRLGNHWKLTDFSIFYFFQWVIDFLSFSRLPLEFFRNSDILRRLRELTDRYMLIREELTLSNQARFIRFWFLSSSHRRISGGGLEKRFLTWPGPLRFTWSPSLWYRSSTWWRRKAGRYFLR